MKLFFHGLLVCFGLFASMALTGCGTTSGGNALYLDTPRPRTNPATTEAPANSESFFTQPQQRQQPPSRPADTESFFTPHPPSQSDVARFRIAQTVTVSFSGTPEPIAPHEEVIKEDGTITLPLIGSIQVVGKTAGEVQTEIHDLYVPKYYVRLNITVKQGSGDLVYYVGGEVKGSGRQLYVGDTTVTKAIQSAGGLTDFASHRKVWLIRASNGQRIKVNYDEALKNPAKDPLVYPDDQINVEARVF